MNNFNTARATLPPIETEPGLSLQDQIPPDPFLTQTADNVPLTDEGGNLLPEQTTDLRAVANDRPWVLEGPILHRLIAVDALRAIVDTYRAIPPGTRAKASSLINGHGPSSERVLADIAAGIGAKAIFRSVLLPLRAHGGPFDWAHYR